MPSPQFKLWAVVDERTVCRFTSDAKDRPSRELLEAHAKPTQCAHVHRTMNWNCERIHTSPSYVVLCNVSVWYPSTDQCGLFQRCAL